jgi:hypothetical protein
MRVLDSAYTSQYFTRALALLNCITEFLKTTVLLYQDKEPLDTHANDPDTT